MRRKTFSANVLLEGSNHRKLPLKIVSNAVQSTIIASIIFIVRPIHPDTVLIKLTLSFCNLQLKRSRTENNPSFNMTLYNKRGSCLSSFCYWPARSLEIVYHGCSL